MKQFTYMFAFCLLVTTSIGQNPYPFLSLNNNNGLLVGPQMISDSDQVFVAFSNGGLSTVSPQGIWSIPAYNNMTNTSYFGGVQKNYKSLGLGFISEIEHNGPNLRGFYNTLASRFKLEFYNKGEAKHSISFGVSATYACRSVLNLESLHPSFILNEKFKPTIKYLNINGGFVMDFHFKNLSLKFGVTGNRLNSPNLSFFDKTIITEHSYRASFIYGIYKLNDRFTFKPQVIAFVQNSDANFDFPEIAIRIYGLDIIMLSSPFGHEIEIGGGIVQNTNVLPYVNIGLTTHRFRFNISHQFALNGDNTQKIVLNASHLLN